MRRAVFLIALLLTSTVAFAQQQIRTPRQSPKASLTQTVGVTDITINYSRPGVKGRQVWGSLVPYGEVWRTGANEATTIEFSDDVVIGGQTLPKGTYSLHTIPGPDEWTIIFNTVADQWGSYSYDPAKDAVRVTVRPEKADFREWMGFEIAEMTTDTAKIALRWENVAIPFTIDTRSTERTMTRLRNAMQPDWRAPYAAANFAFETPGAATEAEMNAWLDQSLKINQNIANLWLKAQVLNRQNRRADAIRHAEMAIAAATPQQKDFANFIRTTVDSWK